MTLLPPGSIGGAVPGGMPSHLAVGLVEDPGLTWMKESGVAWDARYHYFTKGWVNNGGWGGYDGSWGLACFNECHGQGFMPVVQFYPPPPGWWSMIAIFPTAPSLRGVAEGG